MRCKARFSWLVLASMLLGACAEPPATRATATGLRFLSTGEDDGFARAVAPRTFSFPRDHGAHPEFRTEWWYFTGNLSSTAGRHFGFELTFFRYAITPEAVERESHWGAQHIYMAHFAITDTQGDRFVAHEKISRGALELAGASGDGLGVWVESWSARQLPDERIELSAAADDAAIGLVLRALKAPVLQGEQGLDRKGPEPGNASYYYSIPRLEVTGTVAVADEQPLAVTGTAWLDREWATSSLNDELSGWDWFALQLDDGRDVMYYRLRTLGGATSPYSGGTVSTADGQVMRLGPDDVSLEVRDTWSSAASGARYPVAWRFKAPLHGIDVEIVPRLRQQELDLSVRYWEGAVSVKGHTGNASAARELSGRGYVELAGY